MTTRPGGLYNKRGSTKPFDAPQALVGRVLDGRFRLDEVLNAGGMGLIFIGVQLSVNRPVAVKVLKPTLSDEVDLARRFQQEVELVATLSHPNIVSLVDAGRDAGGLTYLVMEYVDGQTFRQVLQSGTLSLTDMLEIFIQVCEALIEAHSHQIIHRDLKFDNIMLKRRQDHRIHAKVLDFGVAKILSRDVNLTRGGQVPGTPGIIAPELVAHNVPSPQSDLYSVGVLLYTTLTGAAPFKGINDLELMRAHQFEPVPNIHTQVQAYVPEALVELTYALLEKDPKMRPESARDLRNRLETIQNQLEKDYRDLPPYIPPAFEENEDIHGSGAFRVVPKRVSSLSNASNSVELQESFLQDLEEKQEEDRERPFMVVPTSIVTMLVLVLMVLLIVIAVLIRQIIFGGG